MSDGHFYVEGLRLLTPETFWFMVRAELRRAVRAQTFLTLVVLEAKREWDEMLMTADDGTVAELGQLIGREIRDTDLVSRTDPGMLSVALLDTDLDSSRAVIDRFVARLDNYEFATPLLVAVGAACYPTHAVDAESLHREAVSRPLVRRRAGGGDRVFSTGRRQTS
jgi:GGDEF domain-containing protein